MSEVRVLVRALCQSWFGELAYDGELAASQKDRIVHELAKLDGLLNRLENVRFLKRDCCWPGAAPIPHRTCHGE